jgi:hypothetical protein
MWLQRNLNERLEETPRPHSLYLYPFYFFLIANGLEKLIQKSNTRKRELKDFESRLNGSLIDQKVYELEYILESF